MIDTLYLLMPVPVSQIHDRALMDTQAQQEMERVIRKRGGNLRLVGDVLFDRVMAAVGNPEPVPGTPFPDAPPELRYVRYKADVEVPR